MRISRKVALVYLVTVLPLVALAAALLFTWYSNHITLVEQDRLNNARLVATAFRTTVVDIGTASRSLAVRLLDDAPAEKTPRNLTLFVEDLPLHWTAVADAEGVIRYASDAELVGRSIEDTALARLDDGEQVVVAGDSRRFDDAIGFLVASAVDDAAGVRTGTALSFVDPLELTQRLARNPIGGGAHVVDSAGTVVVLFEFPEVALELENWGEYPVIRSALEGTETIDRDFAYPPTGQRRVIAAVPISTFGWEASSATDYDDAMRPFLRAVGIALLIGLGVFALSALAASLVTRSILSAVASLEQQAAMTGNPSVEPARVVRSGDELEEVSEVLSRTDRDLRSYISGLEALGDSSRLLSSSRSTEEVHAAIVQSALRLFQARVVWVFVKDEKVGLRVEVWFSDRGEEAPERASGAGEGIVGRVYQSDEFEVFADVDAVPDARWREMLARHDDSHVAETPLHQGGRAYGVLGVAAPGIERWTSAGREATLLRAFGNQVATVMENVSLYEGQSEVADTLQQALLTMPEAVPRISFAHLYHSASHAARVGGDFYDLFELDEGRIGIVIGDVAGKGLEAAVMTSLVKNVVRGHASEPGKSPAEVVRLTNELVFRQSPPEAFVTLFLGCYDPAEQTLTYCNAGHTTAALLSEDRSLKALGSTSSIVGAFQNVAFDQETVAFTDDQTLFLYTDGLTEARRDAELFGERRLFELLGEVQSLEPRPVIVEVVRKVVDFTGGTLNDDLAVLAVRPIGAQVPGSPAD